MRAFPLPWLALLMLPAVAVLGAVVWVSLSYGLEVRLMTQDVTKIGGMHPLTGVLSSLGIVLWSAAASVGLFAAITARNGPPDAFRFLLSAGLLSTYLLLDDLFLLHDAIAPRLGLPENLVYLVVGAAVMAHLVACRRTILRTQYGLLLLALAFLSSSVAMDTLIEPRLPQRENWFYFLEDGAKWLGIVSWAGYQGAAALQLSVPPVVSRGAIVRDRRMVRQWMPGSAERRREGGGRRVGA